MAMVQATKIHPKTVIRNPQIWTTRTFILALKTYTSQAERLLLASCSAARLGTKRGRLHRSNGSVSPDFLPLLLSDHLLSEINNWVSGSLPCL
ncbi:hypothetical protein PBY51_016764 [Eleginops maclovinus]|uniref:Uncharacterized protein n=1 Tax=Eleginops maclovinus TaxID=56733 RepID=A0AAN7WUF3_ELEMC|nr:hypothetical protein PBY51_016764 [Eleginops maclovinus]